MEERKVQILDTVNNQEDLKRPTGTIRINPPPEDGRCEVCGRHINELKPFGGRSNPLVGDFTGALLIKKFRPAGPYNEEAVKAWEGYEKECQVVVKSEQPIADGINHIEYEEREEPLHWFIAKFGKNKGEELYWMGLAYGQVGASWECRDCFVLELDKYFEKLSQIKEADLSGPNYE